MPSVASAYRSQTVTFRVRSAATIPNASRMPPMRTENTRTEGGGRMGGPSAGSRRSGQNIWGKSAVA